MFIGCFIDFYLIFVGLLSGFYIKSYKNLWKTGRGYTPVPPRPEAKASDRSQGPPLGAPQKYRGGPWGPRYKKLIF